MKAGELVARVRGYGWVVRLNGGSPRLVKADPDAAVLPFPLVDALRANRDAVVGWLSVCGVCGRDVSDDEDRDRLVAPLFCDRGREPRCPYKD